MHSKEDKTMTLRTMTKSAILMTFGLILHMITPAFFGFMKPDFMLAMMFVSIFSSTKREDSIGIGILAGLMTGITSAMPGGLLANIIDKIITSQVIYTLTNKNTNKTFSTILGTILSGLIFLSISSMIVSVPSEIFIKLIFVHVIPASIINGIFVKLMMKHQNI